MNLFIGVLAVISGIWIATSENGSAEAKPDPVGSSLTVALICLSSTRH